MTHRAAGSTRGVPRIWLLPLLLLTAILAATVLGYLSRTLVLDLVAWWPVWLLLLMVTVLTGGRRIGRLRITGLVSILVAGVLAAFVIAHLSGWALNPSASRYLAGPPPAGYTEAALAAAIPGDIVVTGGSEFLYEVDLLQGGGGIGIPTAEERQVEDAVSVTLAAPDDPGFDSSAGWIVGLSPEPAWDLQLQADELDLDLSSLRVSRLELAGAGDVVLAPAMGLVPVTVDGALHLSVPSGAAIEIIGQAQVPDGWERLADGWRSPAGGDGWVLEVPDGSVVSVVER